MKTVAILICCSVITFWASAQIDTTKNVFKPLSDTSRNAFRSNQSPVIQNPVQPVQPPLQYRLEDRVVIQHNELPNSLRETLMGSQYKGWENSVIYQDRVSGEYYYNTNINPQSPPSYLRFDRNGKAIPQSGTGNDDQ